jgi:hypothetical protein
VSLGLDAGHFWNITPREMAVVMDGAVDREKRDAEARKQLTYMTGSLVRAAYHAKRFPKYQQVFPERKRHQTQDDMISAMRRWTEVIKRAQGE